ncbi:MAG: tripartite tricarboxylate transporter TctB family protein [Treponema sp.]|nr:tripartite tricarboxylate transporter TctB family protein [Treponema sp.]
MKRVSIGITLFFMAMAVGVFAMASTFPGAAGGAMGPGFFPMVIAGIVFFLCVLLLFSSWNQKDSSGAFFTKTNSLVFLAVLITAGYVAVIRFLGFPLATFLYLFCMMKFLNVKGKIFPVIISACTTGIIYAVFTMFLSVLLPRGMIF